MPRAGTAGRRLSGVAVAALLSIGAGAASAAPPGYAPPVGKASGPYIRTDLAHWDGAVSGRSWASTQLKRAECFAQSPLRTPNGFPAIRLSISAGDDPFGNPVSADNPPPGLTRAEFSTLADATGASVYDSEGVTRYYAAAYWFPPGFAGDSRPDRAGHTWFIPLQEHGPDNLKASPTWALFAGIQATGDRAPKLAFATNGGDVTVNHPERLVLSDVEGTGAFGKGGVDALAPGRWVRVIVGVRYASDRTGFYKLYRLDEATGRPILIGQRLDATTLQFSAAHPVPGNHYVKQGVYRGQVSSARTDSFDFGPLGVAGTLADAVAIMP